VDISIEQNGAYVVAHVSGALDMSTVEEFSNALHDYATGDSAKLAVEMSRLESVDSTGLSALMTLVTRARLSQGKVVLVAPTPLVRGVFDVTRLNDWFDICEHVEETTALFARP